MGNRFSIGIIVISISRNHVKLILNLLALRKLADIRGSLNRKSKPALFSFMDKSTRWFSRSAKYQVSYYDFIWSIRANFALKLIEESKEESPLKNS